MAGMDNDTTEFPMTAAVQPGNSGGPVLDGSGALLGVTVARMNDVAALMATNSVPQTVNFGIEGDVAASFLRVNGVDPKTGGSCGVDHAADRGGRQGVHGTDHVFGRRNRVKARYWFRPQFLRVHR